MSLTGSALAAVGQEVDAAIQPFADMAENPPDPVGDPIGTVATVGGALLGAAGAPLEMLNTGFASATNAIAAVLPAFPAAHMGSMYMGVPHAHAHPPSLVPPAPPVPLPSMGAVTLGCSIQVLVGGMPAARAGDLGLAPTCVGFAPLFEIFTGSSKVFIAGARAARQLDVCMACSPNPASAGLRAAANAMQVASQTVALAALMNDLIKSTQEPDPAMAAAMSLSGSMAAAQMAADAAAMAMAAAMGTDPAIPPKLPGAITMGASNVQIAGIPTPNFPDPAAYLFGKLKGKLKARKKKKKNKNKKDQESGSGC